MTDDDLSTVTSEAMLEELRRRYDGLLVVREKLRTAGQSDVIFDYSGGLSRCIGLADRARVRLLAMADAGDYDAEDV